MPVSTGFENHPALSRYAPFGFNVVAEDEPLPSIRVVRLERISPDAPGRAAAIHERA